MSSSEKIIKGFSQPTIMLIVGQLCFDTLKELKLCLSINAASIISHLGNNALGLLWLTVSSTVFNTLSFATFIPPVNPGSIPIIPPCATAAQINTLTDAHKREAKLFQELNNTNKALKQQLLGAVDDMFTRALKNRYIGYKIVATKQLIPVLYIWKSLGHRSPYQRHQNERDVRRQPPL